MPPMTSTQLALAQRVLRELKTVSLQGDLPHDMDSFSRVFGAAGIQQASVDLHSLTATGFTGEGLNLLVELARTFRAPGSSNSRVASNATLAKVLGSMFITRWKDSSDRTLSAEDSEWLNSAVDRWFGALNQAWQHVVPVTLTPFRVPPFSVGPVTFHHLQDFPPAEFGRIPDDFFARLRKLGGERYASWMAVVDVVGRSDAESLRSADIAVDVALAALQLALGDIGLRYIARATGRSKPIWRVNLCKSAGAGLKFGNENFQPGHGMAPAVLAANLAEKKTSIESMGRRLSAYLAATSPLPNLDEAWCNAAYWYHQALGEDLDTVAVIKLEIAIEVLFRSENMSGSKRRLLDSLQVMFGLRPSDPVFPGRPTTAEQLCVSITTARSRVLHGTWPTLGTDLPGAKQDPPVSISEAEWVARSLLREFTHRLDAYHVVGQIDDGNEAFLAWIAAQKGAAASNVMTP